MRGSEPGELGRHGRSSTRANQALTKILDAASTAHRKLDPSEGLQDAQLDDGARVHLVHGDIARGGHLLVNIRKFTGVAFRSLDQLVKQAMLTSTVAAFLRACVRGRQTIVFAGAPGSGKTTMLSCCAAELIPELRVVVAEEVFEADIALANVGKTVCSRWSRSAVLPESFFATLECELIHEHRFRNLSHPRAEIMRFIDWYNTRRRHTALDSRSPDR